MANKALSKQQNKRQKLTIRIEPSQKALKPRNPVALAARQRVAGSHKATVASQRQQEKRQLQKKLRSKDESESNSDLEFESTSKPEPKLKDE